ncbi:PTS system glucoside-specific EIICBA component [Actinomadura rubteroloni]|uniref:PTS system glucoside-specific EIICBA component n=1 Tax=Actinomadura rubteroloni TaxID=1926885 RepID=A0A2P4UPP1_9ACTN|nr:PTS transporter subunit EIIC [Actinomadura rubteroloni]POM27016.1 PTS system glucoside-specific EIICBA component [Actinomadura rubteroloni]
MTSATAAGPGPAVLAVLQRIGRSLMLPIAVLPAAAILLRLGQDDLLGASGLGWDRVAEIVGGAGEALFGALPLLFAVGVAIGFARKADGSTALAAVVGYLVFDRVSKIMFSHRASLRGTVVVRQADPDGVLHPVVDWGAKNPTDVLGGILIGVLAAVLYQRYHRVAPPPWLAFFGGRRFVPIATALGALVLGVLLGLAWPVLGGWLTAFGDWITGAGALGAGVYGVVNRLLLPFGLHHIPNSLIWFVFGTYHGPDGVVHGEINRYLAGDPHAGGFTAGFFPVLMFGLPGAALAIWRTAAPERRRAVGGLMISAALTAFVTGVTEPIEFAFMFVAPVLYGVHVVLTGVSLALLDAAGARLGFGFSAGCIDLVLNASKDNTRGLPLIIGLGIVYFVLYYVIFSYLIRRFDFATPGREKDEPVA